MLNSTQAQAEFCLGYDEYLPLAEKGDAEAQKNIGHIYYVGDDTIQEDHKKAFTWYSLAAQQGDEGAQIAIGAYYYYGEEIPKDLKKHTAGIILQQI